MTTPADWTFLDLDGVAETARRAARKVAAEYPAVVEADDLYQDALILLARNSDQVRKHHESGELGLLHHWLWCRLVDTVRPLARRANRSISYERTYQEAAA